jgi:hypothetical protein
MTAGYGYRAYTGSRHALRNIHHLRELTFLQEQYQQTWAGELKGLLLEMKHAVELARATGAAHLAEADRRTYHARYWALVETGLAANPPPTRRAGQRGRLKQSPARNLLERLALGHEEVLAFLDDLTHPLRQQPGRARSAHAQNPAKGLRCVSLHERLRGLRLYPQLLLHLTQTRHGAIDCPRDRLRRSPTLPSVRLNCQRRPYLSL